MGKFLDQWYPFAFGLVLAGCYLLFLRDHSNPSSLKELFQATLNICAIAAGFLASAKAILFSVSGSKPAQWLKSGGEYQTLINYLLRAIQYCMLASILSAVNVLLWKQGPLDTFSHLLICSWIFLCVASLLSSYRVINLLAELLKRVS